MRHLVDVILNIFFAFLFLFGITTVCIKAGAPDWLTALFVIMGLILTIFAIFE